ncbi:chloride channel protein, partial [Leuconostoc mesenteroides]|uniref:chloride channel protein n=1 Tax=Leuconostoc mesenteroides TaxID=1245 RepID=UPI003B5CB1C8
MRLNTSKLSVVLYGALIGFLTGIVVSVFRWTIGKLLQFVQALYVDISHGNITLIFFLTIANFIGFLIVAWMLNKEPNISGSGIPQVEGLLLGELKINWWSTLWRKFISGILAIGSGLMLGREGPSIQLGASIGQGV